MTFEDIEILWSHPWDLTERERILVDMLLRLKDHYRLPNDLDDLGDEYE